MLGKPLLTQYQSSSSSQNTLLNIDISKAPLTDLHVHVDGGTLTQNLVTELAMRNNLGVDLGLFRQDGSIYYQENDFIDFLTVYDKVADYIRTAADYEYITYEYLKSCARHGTAYVEVMFSPDHAKVQRQRYGAQSSSFSSSSVAAELSYQDFVDAIVEGINKAKNNYGIEARIVMALLRHNGAEGCMNTLNEVLTYLHPYVVGIDLVGDEKAFPAPLFSEVFEKARNNQLKTAAHAGEHAPAQTVRETLQSINPDRISHGLTCYTDEALVQELVEREIGLTMCLTSNVRLGAWEKLSTHPFRKLLEVGVKVSINTDDPSFWSTDIHKEYMLARNNGNLSIAQMTQLLRNGVETSFAEGTLKNKLLAHVDLYNTYVQLILVKDILRLRRFNEALSGYKKSPTYGHAALILRSLEKQPDLYQEKAKALMKCHRDYYKACREHEAANKEQLTIAPNLSYRASNGMLADVSDEAMADIYSRNKAQRSHTKAAFR